MRARTRIQVAVGVALGFWLGSAAHAIPALQLGAGTGTWTYNTFTQTWETRDNPLNLLATANATTGNGAYAWTTTGSPQYAYLVVSAVPMIGSTEPPSLFDITIENDGGALGLYTFGNGAPPIQDTNDLPSHGIFDTYFEIYEFSFDGAVVTISDTQPGGTGTGDGFEEFFDIAVTSLADGVTQLHFDLFTVQGSGHLDLTAAPSNRVVSANAPFSHDAQAIPEPGAVGVFSIGLLVAGVLIARFKKDD